MIDRFPSGTAEIPYPHKVFRWSDGTTTLSLETIPGGWFDGPTAPELDGWECFFVSHFGSERIVYSYRPIVVALVA